MSGANGNPANGCWRATLDYETSSDDENFYLNVKGGAQLLQPFVDANPNATIFWNDGVAAFGSFKLTLSVTGKNAVTKTYTDTSSIMSYGVAYDTFLPERNSWTVLPYTIPKTHSPQSISLSITDVLANAKLSIGAATDGPINGTSTASVSLTIPAKASYTVSFDANGGSGAPSAQTKWHGETLALPSAQPTRPSHKFLGWSEESGAASASYQAGGSYTKNQAAKLYAVWQPLVVLSNLTAQRVNTRDVLDEAGGCVRVTADYQSPVPVIESAITVGTLTATVGGLSAGEGTISAVLGDGLSIDPLRSYPVTLSSTSEGGTTSISGALAVSSTYVKPTVSVTAFRRVASASDSEADDLGHYLYAAFDYAIFESDSQTVPEDIVYGFANAGPASGHISLSLEDWLNIAEGRGSASCHSNRFEYDAIAPDADYANELTVSVSDKFYTASATADLPSYDYLRPSVSIRECYRSDASGNLEDEGTTATVVIRFEVDRTPSQLAPSELAVSAYDESDTLVASRTLSQTESSGTFMFTFAASDRYSGSGDDIFSTESKYRIEARVSDLYTSATVSETLPTAYFTMDVLAGGHGVAFGKPSTTAELLDVGYEVHSDVEVTATDSNSVVHKLTEKLDASDVGVTSVKGSAETDYRTGDVNLTPADIGAVSKADYRIGGENLLRGTAAMANGSGSWATGTWRSSGSSPAYSYQVSGSPVPECSRGIRFTGVQGFCQDSFPMYGHVGERMTFGAWFKGTAGDRVRMQPYWTGESGKSESYAVYITLESGGWEFHSVTSGPVRYDHASISVGYLYADTAPASGITVCGMKLEWGEEASAWTPAPGDAGEAIESITRSGTTFTATRANGTTFTFTQQDNNTTYSANNDYGTAMSGTQIRLGRKVLYNNASGTNGTVTLSASAANYNHMRIYFRKPGDSNANDSVDVFSPNGKHVSLICANKYDSGGAQISVANVTVSGTSVSRYNGAGYYFNPGSNGAESGAAVAIIRVEAWNE